MDLNKDKAVKMKREEEEMLKYEGTERATNNKDIDDFFSCKFISEPAVSRKAKPSSFKAVLRATPKKEPPKKRDFSGTDYIQKFTQEFKEINLSDTCSSINFSRVSGPSNYSKSFFEDDHNEVPHDPCFRDHRINLPIYTLRQEIIGTIRDHSITIISGSTGCGKSTQVPQYIYEDCTKRHELCNVLVSQPRKIAAITVAQRVALERGVTIGAEIGYQVALNKLVRESEEAKTSITYCTTGVILAKLIQRKSMAAFTHIVLDEVHERNVDTDLLIAIIRQFLSLNSPQTKIVLMSATMDTNQFSEFFKIPIRDDEFTLPPIIEIGHETRRFQIDIQYLEDTMKLLKDRGESELITYEKPGITDCMYNLSVRLVSLLIYPPLAKESNRNTTVLVFLPGIHEIETFKKLLDKEVKSNPKNQNQATVHILHSMLSTEDQKKAFASGSGPSVILSTNISESSVTIPNVSIVVDFCLTKYNGNVEGSRMSSLITEWATKNNCTQRAGRSGRIKRGLVYRLVHKHFFDRKMKQFPKPEITCIPLETVILKVKKLDMGPPCRILALSLDPPDLSKIVDAILILKEHGGLLRTNKAGVFEFDDGELTFLGECMASLPCDVRISKLIMIGYLFSVLDEAIIIGAGLCIQGLFKWMSDDKMKTYNNKAKWANNSESDLIAILNAYSKFKDMHANKYFVKEGAERRWCYENGLDSKNLQEMRLWIEEITKRLYQMNIKTLPQGQQPIWNKSEKVFILKIVFGGAFGIANYFLPSTKRSIDRETASMLNDLNPNKTVYFKNMNRNLLGCIYENKIKQTLILEGVCTDVSKVSVTFDNNRSERVFVTFEGEPTDSYEHIPLEMYRAAKLRRLKNGINLLVLDEEKTFDYAEKLGLLEDVNGRMIKKQILLKHPEWCPLPTCFVSEMQGIVTRVISSQKFYFRPYVASGEKLKIDKRYKDLMREINRTMNVSKIKAISELNRKFLAGDFVIVHRIQVGNLERASFIDSAGTHTVTVHLIDSNLTVNLNVSEVFDFIDKKDPNKEILMEYPPQVFECRLKEIQPAFLKSFENGWCEEGTKQFREAVENQRVKIKIYSIIDDVVNVDLYLKDKQDQEICMNDKLIEDGFAEACDESYQSSMAHEQRKRLEQSFETAYGPEIEFMKKIDVKKNKKLVSSPADYKCEISMRLNGPLTPLEVQLRGIAYKQRCYVTIDGSSINQILLNNTFNNFSNKFCVASDVYFTMDKEQIKLRETTMLPNVPGLAVLAALIFSPVSQIRRNKEKTRYVSVLTGLGADKEDQSYFIDRDCVLDIDIELTEDDIASINHLRLSMSHLLFSDPATRGLVNLMDGQREVTLRKIKKQLIDIINKRRIIRGCGDSNADFKWNYDQEEATKQSNLQAHRSIFNMISFPKLKMMSQEHKKMLLVHVQELELCGRISKAPECRECKLCSEFIDTCTDLKMHLLSKKHINNKAHILEMT